MTPAISVLTPTFRHDEENRPDGLGMVANCLGSQTFQDFEWIICAPQPVADRIIVRDQQTRVLYDPPKREGDFYRLNGCWNHLVAAARADLLVFTVDNIWFGPNTLARFLKEYQADPNKCVSSYGHHFRVIVGKDKAAKPQVLWQGETRDGYMIDALGDKWDNKKLFPQYWEMALASIPKAKLLEVGGFDEEYDRVGGGNSEKEAALRLAKAGCTFELSNDIEVRNYTHERRYSGNWDTAYMASLAMLQKHAVEIKEGRRLKI